MALLVVLSVVVVLVLRRRRAATHQNASVATRDSTLRSTYNPAYAAGAANARLSVRTGAAKAGAEQDFSGVQVVQQTATPNSTRIRNHPTPFG